MQRPSTSKPRGICKFVNTRGGCRAGNTCKFLHGDDPLTPYDKTKVCKFFQQGYCSRGQDCWFRHVKPGSADASNSPNSPQEEEVCSICLEKPTTFGLLDNCSHIFCIQCIRSWRNPRIKTEDVLLSKNHRKCPLCRVTSRFIIPSSTFHAGGTAGKERTLEMYKASMARVKCKYFHPPETSALAHRQIKFCPYGRDCFYQHLDADGTRHVFNYGIADNVRPPRAHTQRHQFHLPFFMDSAATFLPQPGPFDDSLLRGNLLDELGLNIDHIREVLLHGPDSQTGSIDTMHGPRTAAAQAIHDMTDRILASLHRLDPDGADTWPVDFDEDVSSDEEPMPALEPVPASGRSQNAASSSQAQAREPDSVASASARFSTAVSSRQSVAETPQTAARHLRYVERDDNFEEPPMLDLRSFSDSSEAEEYSSDSGDSDGSPPPLEPLSRQQREEGSPPLEPIPGPGRGPRRMPALEPIDYSSSDISNTNVWRQGADAMLLQESAQAVRDADFLTAEMARLVGDSREMGPGTPSLGVDESQGTPRPPQAFSAECVERIAGQEASLPSLVSTSAGAIGPEATGLHSETDGFDERVVPNEEEWVALQNANPPFTTDGRGKVVFANPEAEETETAGSVRTNARRRGRG